MKLILYISLLSLLPLFTVQSQDIQKTTDSISSVKSNTLYQIISNIDLQNPEQNEASSNLHERDEIIRRREIFNQTFVIPQLSYYNTVPLQQKRLGNQIPINNDYSVFNSIPLRKNTNIETLSSYTTYNLIGFNNYIEGKINYDINDRISFNGGVYISEYKLFNTIFNDVGLVGGLQYQLNQCIYLKAFGAYSANSNDKHRDLNEDTLGMFPSTYFGGGVEYKLNKTIGLEGGMVRQLNPATGKWSNTPYFRPVFHIWKK